MKDSMTLIDTMKNSPKALFTQFAINPTNDNSQEFPVNFYTNFAKINFGKKGDSKIAPTVQLKTAASDYFKEYKEMSPDYEPEMGNFSFLESKGQPLQSFL